MPPYLGPSTTRTTATATTTITATTATTVKPNKLTLDNLTNYLAQLEQTPTTTPLSNVEEPSSTIAECGEATTLAWDYNINDSDLSAAPAARVDRIFNGRRQKWKNSIKEEDDADEERGGEVKDKDSGSGSGSTPTTSAPSRVEPPTPSSPEKQNHEEPQEQALPQAEGIRSGSGG
ncbi:hypothetical protein N0V85_006452 [Neurospora sp. IMI 360204]|nr:hypothetical protein N0V85_006452 [Neurospora sp. IMI 360204]